MKKLLALVLALVMTLSLAVVGSNAAFKDAEKVNASYAEAVDVLAGMKVFQGYPDNSFQPEGSITRAEVAAIVYRLYTADVADKQASLYATYNKFTDMDGAAWAKGYIGYCGNAALIKGYDAKTFGPADKVTGYQALAMILRAVGYDKNGEFTGADWQLHVAQTAQQLGILKNVKGVDLNAAASRELVAELLFRTAAEVPMVTYTPALGYTNLTAILNGTANATLGQKNFGLTKDTTYGTDKWGRPAYVWYGEFNGNKVYNENTKDVLYATIAEKPIKTYYTAQTECQIAQDYGFKGTKTLDTYTNGLINKGSVTMQATDVVGTVGAQGRLTEVYADRIVMIDTYLAVVTKVVAARLDPAGHEIAAAYSELRVYDGTSEGGVEGNLYTIAGNDYAVGDYILLNAVTTGAANKALNETVANKYYEIVGKAESFVGAQSTIWHASNQHIIDGTTYDDAYNYILNKADKTANTNFNWFKDQYGNVIGSAEIVNQYSYAVLTSLGWKTGLPAGHAVATLRYVDGTEAQDVIVKTIAGDEGDNSNIFGGTWKATLFTPMATDAYSNVPNFNANGLAYVSDEGRYNGMYNGYALYAVKTNADGSVNLLPTNFVNHNYANVKKGVTTIVTGPGLGDRIYADNATVFIVRSGNATKGWTYTNYVGTNAVPTFTSASDSLFYVDANEDGVADYVYIQNGVVDGASQALVVARTKQWSPKLFNNEDVYALRNAQVNGADAAEGSIMSANAGNITKMADSVNEMYYVEYDVNGLVTSANAVTSAGTAIATTGTTVYKMIGKVYTKGEGTLVTDSTNINVTASGVTTVISSWNTNDVPVYGDYTNLKDVADFSKTYTYIVVDTATKTVAKAVYVYNIPDAQIVPTAYTIDGVNVTSDFPKAAPTALDYVADYKFNATATSVSAGTFNGTVKVKTVWTKLDTDGLYKPCQEGEVFMTGNHYVAQITLTVVNADGESYSINTNAALKLNGALQTETGSSLKTNDFSVV